MIKVLKRNSYRYEIVDGLVKIGEPSVKPLINVLKYSWNERLKSEAAKALGEIGSINAVEALIKALKTNPFKAEVIQSAAWALGEIKDDRAIKPLLELLLLCKEGKFTTWNNLEDIVIAALGKLGHKPVVKFIPVTKGRWEVF